MINPWVQMNEYELSVSQLASEQETNYFLTKNQENQLAHLK